MLASESPGIGQTRVVAELFEELEASSDDRAAPGRRWPPRRGATTQTSREPATRSSRGRSPSCRACSMRSSASRSAPARSPECVPQADESQLPARAPSRPPAPARGSVRRGRSRLRRHRAERPARPPPPAARRRAARGPPSPRRRARARRGSGAPARGGSRGSRRARSGPAPCSSSQSAKRSCSSARAAFGQAVVGGVADEQVAEAEGVVARQLRPVGPHELLAHERHQPRRHVRLVGRERLDAAAVEDLALDRAALEHAALGRVELVEPGREQRLDRRRHDDVAVRRLRQPCASICSTKSGLPSAASRIRLARVSSSSASPSSSSISSSVSSAVERLEQDGRRVELAAGPGRPPVEQLRAARCRRAGSGRRGSSRRCGRRGRGRSARPSGGRRRRTTTGAAASSSSLRNAQAISSAVAGSSDSPSSEAIAAAARGSDGPSTELLEHDLDDRPVRDPLAVREAAAAHDRRVLERRRGTRP